MISRTNDFYAAISTRYQTGKMCIKAFDVSSFELYFCIIASVK